MTSARPPFPEASLAEYVVDLFLFASHKAHCAEQLEIFAARYPSATATRLHAEAVREAARAGDLYRYFKALIPHEAALRAAAAAIEPPSIPAEKVA